MTRTHCPCWSRTSRACSRASRVVQPPRLQHRVAGGGSDREPEVSRMTIVVNVDRLPLEQVTKQLNKLINVLKIVELDDEHSVQRELVLVKVKTDKGHARSNVLEIVTLFRAKVVDVAPETVTIEATGSRDKLEALLRVLEPYGIKELVQSGVVAVGRGGKSIADRSLRSVDRSA